ncbi:hypothetical protein BDA96_02G261200 [Sorghum bicolor]|uniref:Reverse transcriptase zinc-binding domain-containing protein n=2 Tax=Sorghum bicolor TaxID=4558 RepID=A0A921UU44_SORBI|nr:hypothetical protein SORBI_3002G249650 [Sorghum bicolor]KAG0544273.1 hypothetical protein BDA96_02G261200 [Sorghum bicolor]
MHLVDYSCVLCNQGCEESSFHLFFECSFSKECWASIPIIWDLNLNPLDMIIQARLTFGSAIFREIFITTCWIIWNTRNNIIFDNGQKNLQLWKMQFKAQLGLVCTKAKPSKSAVIHSWKESYL